MQGLWTCRAVLYRLSWAEASSELTNSSWLSFSLVCCRSWLVSFSLWATWNIYPRVLEFDSGAVSACTFLQSDINTQATCQNFPRVMGTFEKLELLMNYYCIFLIYYIWIEEPKTEFIYFCKRFLVRKKRFPGIQRWESELCFKVRVKMCFFYIFVSTHAQFSDLSWLLRNWRIWSKKRKKNEIETKKRKRK